MNVILLFCDVGDSCQSFESSWRQQLIAEGEVHRMRRDCLSLSEIIMIIILFHASIYRNLKNVYDVFSKTVAGRLIRTLRMARWEACSTVTTRPSITNRSSWRTGM